jgi:hypothetical protein
VTIGPAIPAELVRDPGTLDTWIGSRLADCFAWESFAALNWPAGAECRGPPARGPDAASDWISNRVWETYKEPYELFQATDTSWDPADVGFDDAAPTSDCTDITVGLVGLHIARKVASSPKWIWATFEHEDNVPPAGSDGDGRDYNFFSAQCVADPPTDCSQQVAIVDTDDICCPNLITYPSPDPAYSINQVTRLVPIQASPSIDQRFRQAYAAAGSPFQYLTLVGAQWAKPQGGQRHAGKHGWGFGRGFHRGKARHHDPRPAGNAAAYQRPCNPNGPWAVRPPRPGEACYEQIPEFLRNTSMETLFVQTDDTGTQRVADSCMNCHFAGGVDGSYLWLDAMLNPYALSDD